MTATRRILTHYAQHGITHHRYDNCTVFTLSTSIGWGEIDAVSRLVQPKALSVAIEPPYKIIVYWNDELADLHRAFRQSGNPKQLYRQLSKRCHPDTGGCHEAFLELKAAYKAAMSRR